MKPFMGKARFRGWRVRLTQFVPSATEALNSRPFRHGSSRAGTNDWLQQSSPTPELLITNH
jgi:hypothetical protein